MKATLLGIEIGGTKLQLGRGTGEGVIQDLLRFNVDPDRGAAGIRHQIVEAVRPWKGQIRSVGVGFGGPVDADRGMTLLSHQIAGWDGFPLGDWLREILEVPKVAIQNDADTAALGEARFGAGRGLSPVLYVTIGSGVGGGLIVDGRIYRGAGLGACEIGHLWVDFFDIHSEPNSFVLENLASGWAIGRRGRESVQTETSPRTGVSLALFAEGDPPRITGKSVALSARAHPDGEGARILGIATQALGRALAHAVTLLAPRIVILGGGVSLIDNDLWLEPIREELDRRVFPPYRGQYDLVTAKLGETVVIQGALALAADLEKF